MTVMTLKKHFWQSIGLEEKRIHQDIPIEMNRFLIQLHMQLSLLKYE